MLHIIQSFIIYPSIMYVQALMYIHEELFKKFSDFKNFFLFEKGHALVVLIVEKS